MTRLFKGLNPGDLTNDQNLLHFSFFLGIIVISFKGEDIGNMFPIFISGGFLYVCSEPFVMVLNVRTA